MSKGHRRRPTQITPDEEQRRWDEAFGPRPVFAPGMVMSEEDRKALTQEELSNEPSKQTE